MHFDALTLACLAAELRDTVVGGRVQQLLAPDEQSIGLEVYAQRQRRYLLLVAGNRSARIHLVEQKLRRGVEQPSPLLLLLRKYVRDSILSAVTQPDPTERLLQLDFDHAEHGATTLVLEILGPRSNLLLLKTGGRILDCLHRVWPGEESARPQAPGQQYSPPLPQDKISPVDDGSADYYSRLGALFASGEQLWRALVGGVAGISPTLGRETAWRAAGDCEARAQDADLLAVVHTLQELWSPVLTGDWTPGCWREADQIVGFSAYQAHLRGEFVATQSLSEALEHFYSRPESITSRRDTYLGLRSGVAAAIRRAEKRVERQLEALAGDEPAPGAAATLRSQAEWLLALHSQITPGQSVLEVEGADGLLRISLDPSRTPVEQAEGWFKQAGRWERAARIIPERRAKLQADQAFLAQLRHDLTLAENQPEIAAVREELEKSGLLPTRPKQRAKMRSTGEVGRPRRFLSPQGFQILVGRNARQNEQVTFELATPADLWLHVRDAPGSHVVIRNGGQPVGDETLRTAAQLAAYFSSLRGERAALVIYTPRRNVARAPGSRTGQVLVRREETITVRAELPVGDEPSNHA